MRPFYSIIILLFSITCLYGARQTMVSPDEAYLLMQKPAATSKAYAQPLAAVLSCSDSRLSIENLFKKKSSELILIRTAGNIAGANETAAAEYAVGKQGIPLLVILGHSTCGAVTAALKGEGMSDNMSTILANIKPAIQKAQMVYGVEYSEPLLEESIKLNVFQSMRDILEQSTLIAGLVKTGRVKVVGAVVNEKSRSVLWLGSHPLENSILDGKPLPGDQPAQSESAQEADSRQMDTPYKPSNAQKSEAQTSNVVSEMRPVAVKKAQVRPAAISSSDRKTVDARFIFADRQVMTTAPREPLYITVRINAPMKAYRTSVKVYAMSYDGSPGKHLIFSLPRLRVIGGLAQTQFYWSAKQYRKGYLPKGWYDLQVEATVFDQKGRKVGRVVHRAEPSSRYRVSVR